MLQLWPVVESHPTHPPNVDPVFGAAVSVRLVPAGKDVEQKDAHPRPMGVVLIVPDPAPVNWTVIANMLPLPPPHPPPAPPIPEAQVTLAVIEPVIMAPDDERPPSLLLVLTVAVTIEFPQSTPPGERAPVDVTTTTVGVFELQRTWLVIFFVTGG